MNTSILVSSLKYLTKTRRMVTLAIWIYEELTLQRYSYSKLETSFKYGHFEVSELLIKLNKSKEELNCILLNLIYNKRSKKLEQYVELLIDHGADINVGGGRLLNTAIYFHDCETIEILLKFKPKIDETTLRFAKSYVNQAMYNVLIQYV